MHVNLRHFVAFKFKDSASVSVVAKVVTEFRALKKSISQIQSIESGENCSPENLNKGLTHAFLVSFSNANDRDVYLTHPAHEEFKKLLPEVLEDVLVMDFSVSNETN